MYKGLELNSKLQQNNVNNFSALIKQIIFKILNSLKY